MKFVNSRGELARGAYFGTCHNPPGGKWEAWCAYERGRLRLSQTRWFVTLPRSLATSGPLESSAILILSTGDWEKGERRTLCPPRLS